MGTTAPAFALSGLYGETITLDFLRAGGKPVLLLFSDPGPVACMPYLRRWLAEAMPIPKGVEPPRGTNGPAGQLPPAAQGRQGLGNGPSIR